jgi:hypothetical protein
VVVNVEHVDEFDSLIPDPVESPVALVQADRALTLALTSQRLIVKARDLPDRFHAVLSDELDPEMKLYQDLLGKLGEDLLRNVEANIPNHLLIVSLTGLMRKH